MTSAHRTFHDDFDEPSAVARQMGCRITPAARPGRRHATGAADGSDFKRKRAGRRAADLCRSALCRTRTTPLGLDPFQFQDGVLLDRRSPQAG